jgi:hypothetical protein
MPVRCAIGILPARLAADPAFLRAHPVDRFVLLGLYLIADEHGRFCAEDPVLRRDLGLYADARQCVDTLARVGWVHLYRSRAIVYGVLDQFDQDSGLTKCRHRPAATYPTPPPEVFEAAGCMGHYRWKGREKRTEEPDPNAEEVAPGPGCAHATLALADHGGGIVLSNGGPSTPGAYVVDDGEEPFCIESILDIMSGLDGPTITVAATWLSEYDRRMRGVGASSWPAPPMQDATTRSYRASELVRVANMLARVVGVHGNQDTRAALWTMLMPSWVWDRSDPILQVMAIITTVRARVDIEAG